MAVLYPDFYRHLKFYRVTRSLNRTFHRGIFTPFTGNAIIVKDKDGTHRLFSYVTEMCHVKPDGTFVKTSNAYSRSTANHIGMFVAEFAPNWMATIWRKPDGKMYKTFREAWLAYPLGKVTD